MARRKRGGGAGGGTWLNTYADMVTLLLTFFAVLISMSNTDEKKFEEFIKSFQHVSSTSVVEEAMGNAAGNTDVEISTDLTMDSLYEYLKTYVEENDKTGTVSVEKGAGVVYIRFSSDMFFEPNLYSLRAESYPILSFVCDGLKLYESKIRMVDICGHTASVAPGSTNVSDWRLSGERAATVAIYLEEQMGFDPAKMMLQGYGKNYPVATNATEEGRRRNRRVELIVIGNEVDMDFDIYNVLDSAYDHNTYPAAGGVEDILIPDAGAP